MFLRTKNTLAKGTIYFKFSLIFSRKFSRVYLSAIKDRSFIKKYANVLSLEEEFALKLDVAEDSHIEEIIKILRSCDSPYIVNHFFCENFFVNDESIFESYGKFIEMRGLLHDTKRQSRNKSFLIRAIGMEKLQGPDLDNFSGDEEKNIFKYILQIASGLKWLHAHDIIHHDIKPANIMLHLNGDIVIKKISYLHLIRQN